MSRPKTLPLNEMSIHELFIREEKCTYEIPVYQRNYAWEKDEISALIHDIDDSFRKDPNKVYYIGTLVVYDKKDRVFEVVDGQQRLTTLYIIMKALRVAGISNKLTYRARKKSDYTLGNIMSLNAEYEIDFGIKNGYKYAMDELDGLATKEFKDYFIHKVHIIRYMVPRDIDLNHYFEIMNSRGEQLEKHEIVKAKLMQKLSDDTDRHIFHAVWDCCSEMNVYVQQKMESPEKVFGNELYNFLPGDYQRLKELLSVDGGDSNPVDNSVSLLDIITTSGSRWNSGDSNDEGKDTFQPIIDFPNLLLIVLKLLRLSEPEFRVEEFNLDDKELLNEFDKAKLDADRVKEFAYYLLKVRFLLDNYIVHHSKEEDSLDSNPWKLQIWHKDKNSQKAMLRNLMEDRSMQALQDRMVHLLSMFEVSFTARQRKNYLLYCLLYLMNTDINAFDSNAYADFLDNMAYRYFNGVYMSTQRLSEVNKPIPGSFDEVMLDKGQLSNASISVGDQAEFNSIYGDGAEITRGIPLFVFNYADYKIWKLYDARVRGKDYKEENAERRAFFNTLGCSDFGLRIFDQFYFSRTRRSLEHYFPQNQATGEEGRPNENQINCFGNFAMIGSEANSSGSDWSPLTKLDHYLDSSRKIKQISVASLKFMIMMQMCKDKERWEFSEIKEHQGKILSIMMD